MATREENIKKINAELEQLSDEELDNVVGGLYAETADDSVFLYGFGLLDGFFTSLSIMCRSDTCKEEKVRAVFARFGIGFVYSGFGRNAYYFGQRSLSQEEAWNIVVSKAREMKLGIFATGLFS